MVVVVDTVSATPLRPRHPEKMNRPDAFSPPKPDWIRVRAPNSRGYADTRKIVKENGLVTVCEEAGCPNIGESWDKKHATFMIMGDTCTRACAFCNVKTGMPGALDALEPVHVMDDLRAADVDLLPIGQYLQPTRNHHAVMRYVRTDKFLGYEKVAYTKGFLMVSTSPLTRSSHHAGDDFARLQAARAAISG